MVTVIPWGLRGIDSETPVDTKIHGCARPVYKMAWYSGPSVSADTEGQLRMMLDAGMGVMVRGVVCSAVYSQVLV